MRKDSRGAKDGHKPDTENPFTEVRTIDEFVSLLEAGGKPAMRNRRGHIVGDIHPDGIFCIAVATYCDHAVDTMAEVRHCVTEHWKELSPF